MSKASTTAETAPAYDVGQVYDLHPATLRIGANVRLDTQATAKEFAASIKARGVLEPVTAWVDEDGKLVVARGQRRTLTAVSVGTPTGTVPVRIIDRPADADRITDQLSENLHRAAMHEAEVRDGVEQLALLGVSAAQIAKRTAIKRTTVNAALAVVGNTATRTRMDEQSLSLEQAAAFAEFEDDPEAVEALTRALSWNHSIEHAAQRLRDQRAERATLRTEAERLRAEGLPALDPEDAPSDLWRIRIEDLRTATGEPVPEDQWPSLPGAAVVITTEWEYPGGNDTDSDEAADEGEAEEQDAQLVYVPVWVCVDPAAAGLCHQYDGTGSRAAGTTGPPDDEAAREARAAERRTVIANNKAWKSAEVVRREWLAQFITRRGVPAGAESLICEAVLTADHHLQKAMEQQHPMLRTLLGVEPQTGIYDGTRSACARLATQPSTSKAATIRTLAAVLAAWEQTSGVHTWRNPTAWDARIMTALTGWGYQPSDVEALLLTSPIDTDDTDADSDQPDIEQDDNTEFGRVEHAPAEADSGSAA